MSGFVRLAEIGAGGMGTVYEAIDRATGRRVALKVLKHVADRARFAKEARVLEALSHPAIVRYAGHGEDGDELYLAMEWLSGETLGARLARGPLAAAEAVSLGERLAGALAHAHAAGVVHRDLKPGNVLLVDARLDRAVLIDFGVAKTGDGLTSTGRMIGTPGYMAPEQVRGERGVDRRADLFALGCLLHEAIAGAHPFGNDDLATVMTRVLMDDPPPLDVPPRLRQLIAALLAKDPGERPDEATAIARELAAIGAAMAAGDAAALQSTAAAAPVGPRTATFALHEVPTVDERPARKRAGRGWIAWVAAGAVGLAAGALAALL